MSPILEPRVPNYDDAERVQEPGAGTLVLHAKIPLVQPADTLPSSEWSALGQMLEALRQVIPASVAYCILQMRHARWPVGFSVSEQGGRPIRALHSVKRWLDTHMDFKKTSTHTVYFDSDLRELDATSEPVLHHSVVALRDAEGVAGILVLERAAKEGGFSAEQRGKLDALVPLLTHGARAQATAVDTKCELAILRALGPGTGLELIIDRATHRVIWAQRGSSSVNWEQEIDPSEASLIGAAERQLTQTPNETAFTPSARLHLGVLGSVSAILHTTPLARSCAALRLHMAEAQVPMERLSNRERAVAQLLLNGYQPANIAAITSIAENTVRTYIRRIYRKLGVCSRVELVKVLLAQSC